MTQEEIKMILHQSSEQGVIDKEETEMLRDVFRFSDKRANELMTHRRDLVIFHPDDTKDKVMKTIEEEHYSKYLLVDERKDEIIGVVSVKDIILMVGNKKEFNLREIARPALFIPESLYANKILELFKKNKNKFELLLTSMVVQKVSLPCTTLPKASSEISLKKTIRKRKISSEDRMVRCWWKPR